jgi:hypothetical protein
MRRAYVTEQLTIAQIADQLGCQKRTIRKCPTSNRHRRALLPTARRRPSEGEHRRRWTANLGHEHLPASRARRYWTF